MQGLHVFDPRAVVVVDLESLVHQDHLLRKVDRVLERRASGGPVFSSRKSKHRKLVDPEVSDT